MAAPSNSYSNPLIQTNALSKSFQKGPPKKTCGKCGRSHSHGDCPAHGTTCSKCGHLNHWAQQCRSSGRRNSSTGRSPSPGRLQNRQRCFSGNKPNKGRGCGGGGGGKQKSTPKSPGSGRGRGGGKPFKTNALTVTGLSRPQHPPKVDGLGGNETKESVSMNTGLSRPAHPPKVSGEPFINTFAFDALTSNGNELYDPPSNQGKAYTDMDSDGKTEIITDITCKFKGKLVAMEVKVDPGSETNCIPLSHFRCLFPQLCNKDGSPKENALEPTQAQFEAYDGGIMTSHGWIILPTRDIRHNNKFHPVRYYVVTREEARILISHATATWLGLVKVLCPNKAPRIKRQVASVSKKARELSDSSNSNSLSGPEHPPKVKYFYNNKITTPPHPPKVKYTGTVTVNEQQHEMPTSNPRSHGRRCRRGITVIVALLLGPAHPPKVKFQAFCQNVHTTSHRRIKILTTSTLRAISSAAKTHRTLSKPSPPRSFPGQRSTLSFTNLAQSRSAVWRTFLNFILTVLIDLALSRERMTSRLTLQCHQYSMRGGRCQ